MPQTLSGIETDFSPWEYFGSDAPGYISRPGWYIAYPKRNQYGCPTSGITDTSGRGWFCSQSDCERAIQAMAEAGITKEQHLADRDDQEIIQIMYGALPW